MTTRAMILGVVMTAAPLYWLSAEESAWNQLTSMTPVDVETSRTLETKDIRLAPHDSGGSPDAITFKVYSGPGGDFRSDPDRLPPEREAELLRNALRYVHDHLPETMAALRSKQDGESARRAQLLESLLDSLPQMTFFINHSMAPTKTYMGYSAEDDPEYRWPDTKFAPEGTIKVNLTEKFIRFLDMTDKMYSGEFGGGEYKGNAQIARAAWEWVMAVLVHEALHAWQYHTGPVYDYSRFWDARCEELDCSKQGVKERLIEDILGDRVVVRGRTVDLLKDTKAKIRYETDAIVMDRTFGRREDYEALADAIERLVEADRAEGNAIFGAGKPYHLMSLDVPKDIVNQYLRETAGLLGMTKFAPSEMITYEGQVTPVEVVKGLRRLKTSLDSNAPADAREQLQELARRWDSIMADKLAELEKQSFPYLAEVERVYKTEYGRLDARLPR